MRLGGHFAASWLRLVCGAAVGAVAAGVLGYGLSLALTAGGLALMAPAQTARPDAGLVFSRAGLNFLAMHHVRIEGGGLPGGPSSLHVCIVWPIALWAVLPAAALMVGGFVSRKLWRANGTGGFAAGAAVTVPYIILLAALRPTFAVPSVSVRLPTIPLSGMEFDPGLFSLLLTAPLASTVFHGLVFGLVFGGIGGAGGPRALWRGLVRREGFWPDWARGAMIAIAAGWLVFFLLSVAAAARLSRSSGASAWEVVSAFPAAGLAHYFSHGVTLRADVVMRAGGQGERPVVVRSYRAGIIEGVRTESEKKPVSAAACALFVVPAAALLLGGFAAAKTARGTLPKFGLAARLAGAYALILSALAPCNQLLIRTASSAAGRTETTITVGPSGAQAFVFGFVLALIFGYLGANIYRGNASR